MKQPKDFSLDFLVEEITFIYSRLEVSIRILLVEFQNLILLKFFGLPHNLLELWQIFAALCSNQLSHFLNCHLLVSQLFLNRWLVIPDRIVNTVDIFALLCRFIHRIQKLLWMTFWLNPNLLEYFSLILCQWHLDGLVWILEECTGYLLGDRYDRHHWQHQRWIRWIHLFAVLVDFDFGYLALAVVLLLEVNSILDVTAHFVELVRGKLWFLQHLRQIAGIFTTPCWVSCIHLC